MRGSLTGENIQEKGRRKVGWLQGREEEEMRLEAGLEF